MLRQILLAVSVVCFLGIVAQRATAQSNSQPAPQSLGQRLQQFRDDVLGTDGAPIDAPQAAAPTLFTPRRQPTPAGPGQKASKPLNFNRPSNAAAISTAQPSVKPTVQPNISDDMPLPPPSADPSDDLRSPQSRLKSIAAETGRSSNSPVGFDDISAGDEGLQSSARRGDAVAPRAAAKTGSALNPIPLDAARQPTPGARSRVAKIEKEKAEIEKEEPAPSRERFPDPAPQRVARLEPKAELKPEPKVDATPRSAAPKLVSPVDDSASASKRAPDGVLILGQSASLVVEAVGPKSITIGKEAVFSIKVRNSGDIPASGVVVAIAVPGHVEVLATQPTNGAVQTPAAAEEATMLEWQINRLEPRGKETLTLKLVPRKSLPIELAMRWAVAPDGSQALVEVQEPRLTMGLSGPSEMLYGQSKIYKIVIANPGNGDAENVTVALLPIGRASEGGASRRMGTLRPGQSKTIEVELTARQSGMLNIKAEASADGGLEASAVEQVVVRRANLKAVVQAPRIKFSGTSANYTIVVGNNGNATAENVAVSAVLPPQAKYLSGTPGGKVEAAQGKVAWNIGSLPAGAERAFEVHCILQAAGENRLQVAATASDDQTVTATGLTRVEAVADLKLEIKDPQGPVAVGDEAVYEVLVRNRGSKSAEGVDLVAFFTEGLEAVKVHGAAHQIGRGQVVFKTIPTLAPGAEMSIKIHAKAEAAGNHVFRAEVACQSPMLKLSAEETTLFYGDDNGPPSTEPTSTEADAAPAMLPANEQ